MVLPLLGKGHDVFAGELALGEMVAAIGADVAVAGEELGVGQARAQVKGVDIGHALGADDAVDRDDGLCTRDGVVPAMEHRDLLAHFPADLVSGIVQHRLFERNPGLGQTLRRQLENLHTRLQSTAIKTMTRVRESRTAQAAKAWRPGSVTI